ncbi:MAG: hypothetical protein J6B39_07350 [Lachnospiraceae bacterium]|nr:hypothetical protein [Lachnospiraceae bacterium]
MSLEDLKVISGVYTAGSPGVSTFPDEGDDSAINKMAEWGYTGVIVNDVSIGERACNEAAAKRLKWTRGLDVRLRQGWIVMVVTGKEHDCKSNLLTLFPRTNDMERFFAQWSAKYLRQPYDAMRTLPFGDSSITVAPVFTAIPIGVIDKYRDSLFITNAPLEGGSAIPFNPELNDYYDAFFVAMDGRYSVNAEQIMCFRKLIAGSEKLMLPHFGVRGGSKREAECLQELLNAKGMFPLPANRSGNIAADELHRILGLLDRPEALFELIHECEVVSSLIPGAEISQQFNAVEMLPAELMLNQHDIMQIVKEVRERCMGKVHELYAEGDMRECAEELLEEELEFLVDIKGYSLMRVLLLLHYIIDDEPGRCILLKDFAGYIPFLLGLSRYDVLENELGNNAYDEEAKAEVIGSVNCMEIVTSPETYELLTEGLCKLKPGQVATLADRDIANDYVESLSPVLYGDLLKAINSLGPGERERFDNAVISMHRSTDRTENVLIAFDKACIPGINVDGSPVPVVSHSFCRMMSYSILFNLYITKSKTLSHFESLNRKLQGRLQDIPKSAEKKIFDKYLADIDDKCIGVGIEELTELFRIKIAESRPRSRYELALLYGEYHRLEEMGNFSFCLQMTDVILGLIFSQLAFPDDYYKSVCPSGIDSEMYSFELLEAMVFDPEVKEERTELLIIDENVDMQEYLMVASDREWVMGCYAMNKLRYPRIIL